MQEKHDLLELNVRLDEELKYMLGREDAMGAAHEPTPPVSPAKVPSAAVASPLREQVAAVALQQQLDKVCVHFNYYFFVTYYEYSTSLLSSLLLWISNYQWIHV